MNESFFKFGNFSIDGEYLTIVLPFIDDLIRKIAKDFE